MSWAMRAFLWCPAWHIAFAISTPINHVAKCRMAAALGLAVTWRHVFGLSPVNAESMTAEGCRDAS